MSRSDDELTRLQAMLGERQARLTRAAVDTGSVDAREYAALRRLEQVYEARKLKTHTSSRRIEGAIAAAVLLLFLVLLLARLPAAEIELEAEATGIEVVLATATSQGHEIPVTWMVAEGHSAVVVPSADGNGTVSVRAPVVTMESVAAGDSPGLLLHVPPLRADTPLHITHRSDGTRELAFCGDGEPVRLTMTGRVRFAAETVMDLSPRVAVTALIVPAALAGSARATAGACQTGLLRFRFVPFDSSEIEFGPDLQVSDLRLFKSRRTLAGFEHPSTTLINGKLRIVSVGMDPPLSLDHELVMMDAPSGRLQMMTVGPTTTAVHFLGTVKEVTTGSSAVRRSAMPTLLEWVLSRELIAAGWKAGLSTAAIMLALHRWWMGRS